jgi:formylglycine-generating enzyme required for sulfatase activity
MRRVSAALLVSLSLGSSALGAPAGAEGRGRRDDGMARVGPGTYRPLYPPSPAESEVLVKAFALDRYPVTNGAFRLFVLAHPEWRRDRVAAVFADDGYLSHWASATELGPEVDERQPVVRVSWFAAKAYCTGRDARLPTEAEWELAASASRTRPDGRDDPAWREQILDWYSRPNQARLPVVGSTPANYWGIHDLHAVVWEWVLDFNASMLATDARSAGGADKLTFCGGGAVNATDKGDYPTFMRVAFRSSLRAAYTTHNLGFRCAADVRAEPPEGGAP